MTRQILKQKEICWRNDTQNPHDPGNNFSFCCTKTMCPQGIRWMSFACLVIFVLETANQKRRRGVSGETDWKQNCSLSSSVVNGRWLSPSLRISHWAPLTKWYLRGRLRPASASASLVDLKSGEIPQVVSMDLFCNLFCTLFPYGLLFGCLCWHKCRHCLGLATPHLLRGKTEFSAVSAMPNLQFLHTTKVFQMILRFQHWKIRQSHLIFCFRNFGRLFVFPLHDAQRGCSAVCSFDEIFPVPGLPKITYLWFQLPRWRQFPLGRLALVILQFYPLIRHLRRKCQRTFSKCRAIRHHAANHADVDTMEKTGQSCSVTSQTISFSSSRVDIFSWFVANNTRRSDELCYCKPRTKEKELFHWLTPREFGWWTISRSKIYCSVWLEWCNTSSWEHFDFILVSSFAKLRFYCLRFLLGDLFLYNWLQ